VDNGVADLNDEASGYKEKLADCDDHNNFLLTPDPRGSILFLMNPHKSTQNVDAIPTHVASSAS
jgi:hypothetical protein